MIGAWQTGVPVEEDWISEPGIGAHQRAAICTF
jgi:hypothetical protein